MLKRFFLLTGEIDRSRSEFEAPLRGTRKNAVLNLKLRERMKKNMFSNSSRNRRENSFWIVASSSSSEATTAISFWSYASPDFISSCAYAAAFLGPRQDGKTFDCSNMLPCPAPRLPFKYCEMIFVFARSIFLSPCASVVLPFKASGHWKIWRDCVAICKIGPGEQKFLSLWSRTSRDETFPSIG